MESYSKTKNEATKKIIPHKNPRRKVNSHSFLVEDANDYGVEAATFLFNLRYWVDKHEEAGANYFDGKYWNVFSRESYSKHFTYFSSDQIKRIIKKLLKVGAILQRQANSYDRVMWLTLNEEQKPLSEDLCKDSHWAISPNGSGEIAQCSIIYNILNNKKKTATGCVEELKGDPKIEDKLKAVSTELQERWLKANAKEKVIRVLNKVIDYELSGATVKRFASTVSNWLRRERDDQEWPKNSVKTPKNDPVKTMAIKLNDALKEFGECRYGGTEDRKAFLGDDINRAIEKKYEYWSKFYDSFVLIQDEGLRINMIAKAFREN